VKLTVLIPTYNCAGLLQKLLDSIRKAAIPESLRDTHILVIDNNSKDDTKAVVERNQPSFPLVLEYLFEPNQGKPYALNLGIRNSEGEWIGMIDQDEQIDPSWLSTAEQRMKRDDIDFFGGPYMPLWEKQPPGWLPYPECKGVLAYSHGDSFLEDGKEFAYHVDRPTMLAGGNAFIRRRIFERLGGYNILVDEGHDDTDMYRRLLANGIAGIFVPSLKIYHTIPSKRMRRTYFLYWYFWKGAYEGQRPPEPNHAVLFKVERWRFRYYARFVPRAIADFKACLQIAYFIGFLFRVWISPKKAHRPELEGARVADLRTSVVLPTQAVKT
jgi:glycosyltransferase involved in cell wall biosynthesis